MSARKFSTSTTQLFPSMASLSNLTSDLSFSTDFQQLPYAVEEGDVFGLPNVESFPNIEDGTLEAVLSKGVGMGVPDFCTAFPDRLGVNEANVGGTFLPELAVNPCKMGEMQNPSIGFCQATYDSKSDFWPVYSGAGDVWEIRGNSLPKNGEPVLKVARYSVEERKDRILKYLKKRNQRNFNKTIKYACRKTLADRRRRVRGRFASNSESRREEEEFHKDGLQESYGPPHNELGSPCISGAEIPSYEQNFSCPTWMDSAQNFSSIEDYRQRSWSFFQMKDNTEDWYEEAVQSLMYLPITAG